MQRIAPWNKARAVLSVFATMFLLLVVVVATASGQESGDGSSSGSGAESHESNVLVPAPTNPPPSDTPPDGMSRQQSGDLLQTVFEPVVEAAGGGFDEIDAIKFLAPDVAVVSVESGEGPRKALVDSTIPLRAENERGEMEAIDLSLSASGETIEAANPLVALEIPMESGAPITLPDAGIGIRLVADGGSRQVSVLDSQTAFYPNVAADTDFAVVPTPLGLETLTQIRSADAPLVHRLAVSLPPGATLEETDGGGAKVVRGTELLMTVNPPAALDANGENVPVQMDVDQSALRLTTSPTADAAYPILVDPLFQTYEWAKEVEDPKGIYTGGDYISKWLSIFETKQHEEWSPEVEAPSNKFALAANDGGNYYNPLGLYAWGMGRFASGTVPAGSHAGWKYVVPRFYGDQAIGTTPKTYISKMKVWNLTHFAGGKIANPYMRLGLIRSNGTWASLMDHTSLSGHHLTDLNYKYEFNGDQESKSGFVGLWATEAYAASQAETDVLAQAAQVELAEPAGNIPKFGTPLAGPSGWVNTSAKPFEFVVSDDGLGVYAMNAGLDYPGSPAGIKTLFGCTGTGAEVCPRTWSPSSPGAPAVSFDPTNFPTGVNLLSLVAEDPLGNKSASGKVEVKVDHVPPQVTLSGQLTEQATLGTQLPKYALKVEGKDGDEATASASSPLGAAGTGAGQYERPMGVAVAPDGSIYAVDRLNNKVVKYDASGGYVTQFGSTGSADGQFNDPRGIAVAPDGTVWVADLGNDRIQAFSSSGTFLRKAKFSDPASEPYAIATGPGGVLWVTDTGLKRVVKLTENPITSIGSVSGTELSPTGSATDLSWPSGVATDSFGNVWVVDYTLGKIFMFDSAGKWKFQFGTSGSGNGQLKEPISIDIAPSGALAIMDRGNARVQLFKPNGTYIRQFGTSGSGNAQFLEAVGLSFGNDNQLYVADAANKRIARWNNAALNVQSGVAKTEISVDGALKDTSNPGCAAGKNCSASREWTLNADDYPVGSHNVQVAVTDAAGVSKVKTLAIETHGDLTAPTNVLSGTITQQATLGQTRPAYTVKLQATDPGPLNQRKSGVASIEFKIDGVKVDSVAPGCPGGGCSLTREYTVNSNSLQAGGHLLEAVSMDAAGRKKVTTREFAIKRDDAAPEFQNLAAFYTASGGWLEQNTYEPKVDVVDGNGYGVTDVQLKIDGQVVQSSTVNCPAGGCSTQFAYGKTINMSTYEGGAHPAELVATDGAGNVRKRNWTINVNPDGSIPPEEAVSTLEAVDDTSESTLIAPNSEIIDPGERADGNDPVLHNGIGELVSTGTPNVSTIDTETEEGFAIGIPESTIEVEPVSTAPGASGAELVEESAGVASNTATNVDTIIRPVFNGIMAFQSIRDSGATEYFSWEVLLREGQTLHQVNEDAAEIRLSDGTPAMSIMAEPAHDAVGSEVPTSLTVSEGNVVTLRVEHQASPFIYPVSGGTGWKGGFYDEIVSAPKDQKQLEEERWQREEEERSLAEQNKAEEEKRIAEQTAYGYSHGYSSPPELLPYNNQDDDGASASSGLPHYALTYVFDWCMYDGPGGCYGWKLTLETRFEFNRRFVWWKESKPHPKCFRSTHGWTADLEFCNWVGKNKQVNYGGYHITSRGVWTLSPGGGPIQEEEPVSVYMYPSGYAKGHNTMCICNPSVPD